MGHQGPISLKEAWKAALGFRSLGDPNPGGRIEVINKIFNLKLQ